MQKNNVKNPYKNKNSEFFSGKDSVSVYDPNDNHKKSHINDHISF